MFWFSTISFAFTKWICDFDTEAEIWYVTIKTKRMQEEKMVWLLLLLLIILDHLAYRRHKSTIQNAIRNKFDGNIVPWIRDCIGIGSIIECSKLKKRRHNYWIWVCLILIMVLLARQTTQRDLSVCPIQYEWRALWANARARAHTLARTEQCVSFADYLLIWLFKLVYLRYEASRYYSIAMCEYLYGKR